MLQASRYRRRVGDLGCFSRKIPQGGNASGGNVKGTVGALGILQSQGNHFGQLVGNLSDLPVVKLIEFAVRVGARKDLFVGAAEIQGPLGLVFAAVIESDGDKGIQKEILPHQRLLCAAAGKRKDQQQG